MSLTEISLNVLRAFDASARHLNFTSASKELFVTQAAVAHQVKALEDYIEKPLFNRLARGLALTDAGANLAPIIAKSLEDIGNALETVSYTHLDVYKRQIVFYALWQILFVITNPASLQY